MLSAAKATEVAGSLEGAARPAFSYLMLGAMRGWADDGDGNVTAREAVQYVRRELRGVKGRQQTPGGDGNMDAVLTRGVNEKQPRKITKGIEPASCPIGQKYRKGECQVIQVLSPDSGKAARTLEYLQRRVTFDGSTAFRTNKELEGPEVYYALERPDLAEKWMSHEPWLWIPGIILAASGVALMSYGFSQTKDSTGWFLGGVLGGFFTIGGGATMITFGFLTESHPIGASERRTIGEVFNKQLREERGLGPEVDQQNPGPKAKRGMFNIFGDSGSVPAAPTISVTVRF